MKHLSVKQIPKEIMSEAIKLLNDNMKTSQEIKKMQNYQWILESIGSKEKNSFFANFKLES
jgi:hypothetical protein